jgi:hypothetical protein
LPDRIKSDYEVAMPLIDTTVSVGDFATFTGTDAIPDSITLPEGTPVIMGEMEYPFFIGEYSSSQKVKWLEPFIIIDTKDLPAGTTINIKIYTKNDDGVKIFFWLPENNSITIANTPVRVPETPNRLTNIDQFRYYPKVFLDASITYPEKTQVSKIIRDRIHIKFAFKFEMETDLTINL